MKNKVFIFLTVLTVNFGGMKVFSQNEKRGIPAIADRRLTEVFEKDYIQKLETENPQIVQYYNYFLDNSYYIDPFPLGKDFEYSTVEIGDIRNINPLKLNLKRSKDKRTYYRIGTSDKLLVFYSEDEFAKKLNAQLGK